MNWKILISDVRTQLVIVVRIFLASKEKLCPIRFYFDYWCGINFNWIFIFFGAFSLMAFNKKLFFTAIYNNILQRRFYMITLAYLEFLHLTEFMYIWSYKIILNENFNLFDSCKVYCEIFSTFGSLCFQKYLIVFCI